MDVCIRKGSIVHAQGDVCIRRVKYACIDLKENKELSPTTFTCKSNQKCSTNSVVISYSIKMKSAKKNCKDNCNPGNLDHPCVVTPNNNNVTCTEVDLCELQSPLDLLDVK